VSLVLNGLRLLFSVITLFTVSYSISPFANIKSFLDALTPDNNLEAFTLTLYQDSLPYIIGIGVFSLLIFILLTLFSKKSHEAIWLFSKYIASFPHRLKIDTKRFWASARKYINQDRDWVVVLILMLLATLLRIDFLDKPMTHDEAYTYITFVLGGFETVISDYHLPNNHILYSIFVYISVHLLGNAPWVLRLPALLAGLLLIPGSYLATRQYFNRETALLTSGIITLSPVFILYSTSARGYPQLALLSILLWFFAILLLKHKNIFIWILFIITAATGFYTIPVMVYPYTATMAWLFLSWLFNRYSDEYEKKEFFLLLFFSGVLVVFLFGILYLPVFIKTGIEPVFHSAPTKYNHEPTLGLFRESLLTRTRKTWEEWHQGMPALAWITLTSLLVSFLPRHLRKKKYINYFLVSILIIFTITFMQQIVGWKRIWFFFSPVYFSFAAAGFIYLLKNILKIKQSLLLALIAFLLFLSTINAGLWMHDPGQEMRELRGEPAAIEYAIDHLSTIIEPHTAIVTSADETPAMQYYAYTYGIPLSQTHPADNKFKILYVVLTSHDATIEDTLRSGTKDRADVNASELIYHDGDLKIYQVPIVVFYEE